MTRREPQTTAILAVTGDRGLAGGSNRVILRRAMALGRELEAEGQDRALARSRPQRAFDSALSSLRPRRRLDRLQRPGRRTWMRRRSPGRLSQLYIEGEVDRVIVVYNHFESALVQKVTEQEVLPIPSTCSRPTRRSEHRTPSVATSSTSRIPRRSSAPIAGLSGDRAFLGAAESAGPGAGRPNDRDAERVQERGGADRQPDLGG